MLVTLGVLLLAQTTGVADPRRNYAAGDKDAILMLPPVTVCDFDVREMVWTADGSCLVVRRVVSALTPADVAAISTGKASSVGEDRLRPKLELLVWSAKSRRTRSVLSGDAESLSVERMEAMAGTDRTVFFGTERTVDADGKPRSVGSISMLAAGSGTITRLVAYDPQTFVNFTLSPLRPLGYVVELDEARRAKQARFFGPGGQLGNAVALPPKSQLGFDRAGLPILSLGFDRQGKKVVLHFQKVDPAAGTLGERFDSTVDEEYDPSSVHPEVKAVPVSGTADGARAPSILLKLDGGKPGEAGVVTTDGAGGLISPKGDAVAYVGQGSAIVRPLARVSRQAYNAAVVAAGKAVAMSNAKQVALGLIMFAADMDDVFPSQGDYSKVDPYLKDRSMMDSFTYTYGGGSLASIQNPAGTSIGYVSGPGGRAVAYADGRVVWVPDGS